MTVDSYIGCLFSNCIVAILFGIFKCTSFAEVGFNFIIAIIPILLIFAILFGIFKCTSFAEVNFIIFFGMATSSPFILVWF